MSELNPMYFKNNIKVEPLVNSWYAWSYLVSPTTASMVITNSHMKIMKSYLQSPELHEKALQRAEMLGGPFIDCPADRTKEIENLIDKIETDYKQVLEFEKGVKALDLLLKEQALGMSMLELYPHVPQCLKGYVELFYDLNHKPSFRFIERLLYKSHHFLESAQTVFLDEINQDYRPFALSTPRLLNDGQAHCKLPFSSPLWDKFFSLKENPLAKGELLNFLTEFGQQSQVDPAILLKFFSATPPQKSANANRYQGEGVRVRYFGHACVLIESKYVSILIDPAISYTYPNGIDRYTYEDLPPVIDYLVITHAHQDHVMLEHLIQLRHKVRTVIVPRSGAGELQDPSLRLFFESFGYKNVIEIDEMERIETPGGCIIGLPFLGEHSDLNVRTKIAHLIKQNGKTILCAADSNNLEPEIYRHVKKEITQIDVLFLGMECAGAPLSWLYGPLLLSPITRKIDQSRRLDGSNYARGIEIINILDCQEVYVYAMGQEPWFNYLLSLKYTDESAPIIESNKLVADCLARSIHAERLFGKKEIILQS